MLLSCSAVQDRASGDPDPGVASADDGTAGPIDWDHGSSPADEGLQGDNDGRIEDNSPADPVTLGDKAPADYSPTEDDASQVDPLPTECVALPDDDAIPADTASEGTPEDCPLNPDEGTAIDPGETPDAVATDAVWTGCEVFGVDCTPEDTTIFTTSCYNVPGGVERWPVYATCGQQCVCGLVDWAVTPPDPIWAVPCDQWEGPEVPVPAAAFCATGRRVLCAQPTAPPGDVKVGCCDAEGRVHCEWNPVQNGNRCIEG